MRYSKLFAPTLREISADVEMISHRLLLRAGFIRQLVAGIYEFLPLGWRVLNKICDIIREEMDKAGAQELLLPTLHPRELWAESGREAAMADVLLSTRDRKGAEYYLGPTHEEVITDLVRRSVRSYRDLPLNLYQIQMKFRDEPRPRGGLVRAREFLMKDAYSFDRDEAGLDAVYLQMYETYTEIFRRCGLPTIAVDASSGAIGGKETKEFMLLTDSGEDVLFICSSCGYAANQEIADFRAEATPSDEAPRPMEKVATPGAHTVQQVCDFLGTVPEKLVKTLIYMADGKPVAALVRGDRELNESRLKNLLEAGTLEMATPEQILEVTGGPVGFSGPVGLDVPMYADEEIQGLANFVTGANEQDAHLVNVNWSDVKGRITWCRLRLACEGDACAICGKSLEMRRGMELGHIFKLRYAISEPMNARFMDEDGSEKLIIMGCYGIGVSRIMSAVAEISNDENGLIWPLSIAPYHVHLICANMTDEAQRNLAERVYKEAVNAGIEVLYDDREERAGVKFKDADLIGIPIQVIVGKTAAEGKVEVRDRASKLSEFVSADAAVKAIESRMCEMIKERNKTCSESVTNY